MFIKTGQKELQQKIKRRAEKRSSCTKSKNSLALRAAVAVAAAATTKNLIVYQVQVQLWVWVYTIASGRVYSTVGVGVVMGVRECTVGCKRMHLYAPINNPQTQRRMPCLTRKLIQLTTKQLNIKYPQCAKYMHPYTCVCVSRVSVFAFELLKLKSLTHNSALY